jgi:5-methylcytosine-specific restriction endonuclease McrA
VIRIFPKDPRAHLSPEAYVQLRLIVLNRDSGRCQKCGSLQNLEVHHQQFRSHSGSDSEENLITLCKCVSAATRMMARGPDQTGMGALFLISS